jgi:archaellum component FlaC
MAIDDIMAVDERLSRLETTVAVGFHEQGQRIDRVEDRMFAVENKLDVVADSIRADLKTVLEAVTAGTEEMRRTTDAIRKEHQADRRLMMSILDDHSHRLRMLEGRDPAASH